MNYGYIRVSTDTQTVENQKLIIEDWAKIKNIKIDEWIDETKSGTIAPQKRKLGNLLKKAEKGDLIIVTERNFLEKLA